ncbi:hypothetical protein B0J18DRAFT_55145 [Chaetomium sp. MPI-SDFR-AT-0129]|nr:hypothetical protein B0J18DRAFT_55145 [Chaetomium sp. MPI-SDFR-AT-0129]
MTREQHLRHNGMASMLVYSEVKRLYTSLQEIMGRRRKRQLQISDPFDFKKEVTIIPGLTEDEYVTVSISPTSPNQHKSPFLTITITTNTTSAKQNNSPPRKSSRLPSRHRPRPQQPPVLNPPPPSPFSPFLPQPSFPPQPRPPPPIHHRHNRPHILLPSPRNAKLLLPHPKPRRHCLAPSYHGYQHWHQHHH